MHSILFEIQPLTRIILSGDFPFTAEVSPPNILTERNYVRLSVRGRLFVLLVIGINGPFGMFKDAFKIHGPYFVV